MEYILYLLAKALGANIILIFLAVVAVYVAKESKIAAFIVMGIAAFIYGGSFAGNLESGHVDIIPYAVSIFIFVVSILLILSKKKVNIKNDR
ncbi:MAG: hypothetical protein K5883_00905 [Pseudobutyrivibrio sp.]|nr:hypothetical protein [Pseudobutyrivibrio sp.]